MPPFTTASCTIQDAPSLARNNISAFWQDKTWVIIWPNKTLEYVISQATRRMPRNLLKDIEHLRHVKAVDEATGRVVGYCRWELPSYLPDGGVVGDAWAEGKVSDEGVGEEERREIERAFAEADWSYDHSMDFLDRPIGETKRRLMEGKGYLLLDYLAVHPDHQRQGIASMLVESGIKEAEKLGLDIFVHAKKAGLNVYLRAGFKVLEQIIQDATKYGGDEEYAAYFLVKEAKKS